MTEQEKREKVIKGLECCGYTNFMDKCQECPYDGKDCFHRLKTDAIALLKAQEPVEPQHLHDKSRLPLRCGNCGTLIIIFKGLSSDDYKAKFCCTCGRAVKWE